MRNFILFSLIFSLMVAYSLQEQVTIGEYYYDTDDKLGEGGFGEVYKGYKNSEPNFPIAIKTITKRGNKNTLAMREIQILKELTELDQENLVKLFHYEETPELIYLMMEYCNGGDLNQYLKQKRKLSESTIRSFLSQIVSALRTIYEMNILHRDLKPHNILFSHNGGSTYIQPEHMTLKVGDFGISRLQPRTNVLATRGAGTPGYMAPEVAIGQYNQKADMWSLGVMLYQFLTGKLPFNGGFVYSPDETPDIPSRTSEDLKDLIEGLLTYNQNNRLSLEEVSNHAFLKKSDTAVSSEIVINQPSRNAVETHRPIVVVNRQGDKRGQGSGTVNAHRPIIVYPKRQEGPVERQSQTVNAYRPIIVYPGRVSNIQTNNDYEDDE